MIGRALAVAAPALVARIAGPIGEAARRAADELAALAPAERKERRAEWAAIARAPVPPGLRHVHPSWIEAALAELPARARGSVAAGGGDAVDVWLARWATAAVPAMPSRDVAAWLSRIGAEQLAFAASAAGPRALAAAIAHSGPLLAAAARAIGRAPLVGNLGPRRAAIMRSRDTTDDWRIAARALAPYYADDPIGRRQLVYAMPRPLGLALDHELRAHARTPFDQVPTALALGLQRPPA